jgi:hypothetical protein
MKRFVYLLAIAIVGTITLMYPLSQRTRNSIAVETTHAASPNGSIGAIPYIGPDFDTRPLVVMGTTTNKEKRAVGRIWLKNISNKVAVSAKIGWFVSLKDKPADVVEEGETELIKFSEQLTPGDRLTLTRPFVGFDEVVKKLKEKGKFDSAYSIQFLAREIVFGDGTRWSDKESAKTEKGKTNKSHASATVRYAGGLVVTPTPFCPANGMECVWISDPGGLGQWSCQGSGMWNMYCDVDCITSCCSYFCDPNYPDPGCHCW